MVSKERAANIAALNDAFRQHRLAILPRHNHPLRPEFRIIPGGAPYQESVFVPSLNNAASTSSGLATLIPGKISVSPTP
jgi:hypothetical protein